NKWIRHYYYFYDLFIYYVSSECLQNLNECAREYAKSIQRDLLEVGYSLEVGQGVSLGFAPHTLKVAKHLDKAIAIEWYFGDYEYYLKHKSCVWGKVLIAPWILVEFFISKNVALLLSGAIPKLSEHKKILVGMGHSIAEAFGFFSKGIWQQYLLQYIHYYFLAFDYYLAIDSESLKAYYSIFEAAKIQTKALPAGSIRLDEMESNNCNRQNYAGDIEQFWFIPRLTKPQELLGVITKLLRLGKKVLFRPHPAYCNYCDWMEKESPYACLERFLEDSNFSFDWSEVMDYKNLAKSIVITDNSSVAYSVPFNALRPVVLYAPPKKEFDLRIRNFGYSFCHPLLHRVALDEKEFISVALELERDLKERGSEISQNISSFKDKNVFHRGRAAR
ncbi:MAG: hypothetical protein K2I63_01365, partial [Helicobacter sp.]|nr:hypothetical protein [Helicobacter sp.]